MIPIGHRNQLVTLQSRTEVADGKGGQTVTYPTLGREWVFIEPTTAREAQVATQVTSELTTAVTMRFRTDVSVKDRMTVGSRTLEIISLQDQTARREDLRVLAIEVQA